jgi:hypothetical protein
MPRGQSKEPTISSAVPFCLWILVCILVTGFLRPLV